MKLHHLALAVAAVIAPTAALSAQSSLTIVPEGTAFTDLTPDGETALLHNFFTGDVWLWAAGGGLTPIGGLATSAEGLSSDGSTVAATRLLGAQDTAARWTTATDWDDLGGLAGSSGCDSFLSSSFDISGDGDTIVGLAWDDCTGRAFRYTAAGGMEVLPQMGPSSARANAISNDGLTIGGWDEGGNGARRPALWLPDGSELLIGPADANGEVQVLSNDGSVAAGDLFNSAYYWTAATGIVDLGQLPGGFGFQMAGIHSMTGDGRMLGGGSGDPGPFGSGMNAFVWTEASGMEGLFDRLKAEGADVPDTFRPGNVLGISDDGRTVVGWGIDFSTPFGDQRAYVATLAPQSWFVAGAGLAGDSGLPTLQGSGPQIAKSATTLKVRRGAPGAMAYVVVGGSRIDQPLKGGVLVPSPDVVSTFALDELGSRDILFRWPSGVPAATSFYWQVWIADTGTPAGFAISNGLKSTTP